MLAVSQQEKNCLQPLTQHWGFSNPFLSLKIYPVEVSVPGRNTWHAQALSRPDVQSGPRRPKSMLLYQWAQNRELIWPRILPRRGFIKGCWKHFKWRRRETQLNKWPICAHGIIFWVFSFPSCLPLSPSFPSILSYMVRDGVHQGEDRRDQRPPPEACRALPTLVCICLFVCLLKI